MARSKALQLSNRVIVYTPRVGFRGATLLLNPYTGTVYSVSKKVGTLLKRLSPESGYWNTLSREVQKDLKTALLSHRLAFESAKEEELFFKKICRDEVRGIHQSPPSLYFLPTDRCNLQCSYCYEPRKARQCGESVDGEKQVAAFFKVVDQLKPSVITLFGGEPFLLQNKAILRKFFEGIQSRHLRVRVITNATEVFLLKDLLEEYSGLLEEVQITVDGNKKTHEKRRRHPNGAPTYERVLEAIRWFSSQKIPVQVRMNVDSSNRADIPDVRKKLGVIARKTGGEIRFSPSAVTPNQKAARLERPLEAPFLKGLREFLQDRPVRPKVAFCNNSKIFYFAADGKIYGCSRALGKTQDVIGVYYPRLQLNLKQSQFTRYGVRTVDRVSPCNRCQYALICGGQCLATSYREGKTFASAKCEYPRHPAAKLLRSMEADLKKLHPWRLVIPSIDQERA